MVESVLTALDAEKARYCVFFAGVASGTCVAGEKKGESDDADADDDSDDDG